MYSTIGPEGPLGLKILAFLDLPMLTRSSQMSEVGGGCNSISLKMYSNVSPKHAQRPRFSKFGNLKFFATYCKLKSIVLYQEKEQLYSCQVGFYSCEVNVGLCHI